MWRVAAGEVADHPLLGVGVDNFAVDFVRERSTGEEPLYPHSLALQDASPRPASSAARSSSASSRPHSPPPCPVGRSPTRCPPPSPRLRLPPASTGSCTARSTGCGRSPRSGPPRSRCWGWPRASRDRLLAKPSGYERRSAALLAGAGVLFVLAAGSFALPGLAAIELERGVRAWPDSPDRALSHLERAHRLNPLSERADVVAGTLAQRDGDSRTGPRGISASARAESPRLVRPPPAGAARAKKAGGARRRSLTSSALGRSTRASPPCSRPCPRADLDFARRSRAAGLGDRSIAGRSSDWRAGAHGGGD